MGLFDDDFINLILYLCMVNGVGWFYFKILLLLLLIVICILLIGLGLLIK